MNHVVTLALALSAVVVVSAACIGSGFDGCTQDTECGAGQVCDLTTNSCVAEGEGEGEGEGSAVTCDASAFTDAAGTAGYTATGLRLDNDDANVAGCGQCFLNPGTSCTSDAGCTAPGDACIGAGTSAYVATMRVDGTITSDFSGEEVKLSANGAPPTSCTSFPTALNGVVSCPICFAAVPHDLALQYTDDGGDLTPPVCVDTRSAH